jgi:hypothetical protein
MAVKKRTRRKKPPTANEILWAKFLEWRNKLIMITTAIAALVAANTYYGQLPSSIKVASQEYVQQEVSPAYELAALTRADQLRVSITHNENKLDDLRAKKKPNKSRIRRLEKTIKKQKGALCKLDKTECE